MMTQKSDNSYYHNESGHMELRCGNSVILFDAEDFPLIMEKQWTVGNHGYAVSGAGKGQVLMHRLLSNVNTDEVVDHINMNKLDNRRLNLRKCSKSENGYNKPAQNNNKCGYRGVCKAENGRWQAQIVKEGHAIYLGNYDTAEDAANAYDSAAAHLAGEFAWRNLPEKPLRENIFYELEGIRRSKWLTEDEIERIRLWYGEGTTMKEIASALGRSVDSVRRVLRNTTYRSRQRPSRPIVKKEPTRKHHPRWLPLSKVYEIMDLLAGGYSVVDIAWAVGCSRTTVQRLKAKQTYCCEGSE